MEILQIDPAMIVMGERLRAVDPDAVALLAESIRERGLDAPITVTAADEAGFHRLIAGAHRLSAALAIGLPLIPAIPFSGTEMQAKLVEIEENLIRRELSEMDRAVFLAEHKAIYEALHPEARHGGDRRTKASRQVGDLIPHPFSGRFTAVVAKKLGWSERVIQRALDRHRALSPAIRARIARTWLADNGSALDALVGPKEARRPEAHQHKLLDLLLAEKGPRSVAEAERQLDRLPPPDPADAIRQRLLVTWGKAPVRLREEFLVTLLRDTDTRTMVERLIARLDDEAAAGEATILRAISQGRAA